MGDLVVPAVGDFVGFGFAVLVITVFFGPTRSNCTSVGCPPIAAAMTWKVPIRAQAVPSGHSGSERRPFHTTVTSLGLFARAMTS